MYNEVNLSRHAKFKRKVSKKDICQRNIEYEYNYEIKKRIKEISYKVLINKTILR